MSLCPEWEMSGMGQVRDGVSSGGKCPGIANVQQNRTTSTVLPTMAPRLVFNIEGKV